MTEHAARVLVVDDDERVRTVVSWQLESDGFAVTHASDGAAAPDQIAADRPDLVVLDLSLPGRPGGVSMDLSSRGGVRFRLVGAGDVVGLAVAEHGVDDINAAARKADQGGVV